jgi:hypothetical protein
MRCLCESPLLSAYVAAYLQQKYHGDVRCTSLVIAECRGKDGGMVSVLAFALTVARERIAAKKKPSGVFLVLRASRYFRGRTIAISWRVARCA